MERTLMRMYVLEWRTLMRVYMFKILSIKA